MQDELKDMQGWYSWCTYIGVSFQFQCGVFAPTHKFVCSSKHLVSSNNVGVRSKEDLTIGVANAIVLYDKSKV